MSWKYKIKFENSLDKCALIIIVLYEIFDKF